MLIKHQRYSIRKSVNGRKLYGLLSLEAYDLEEDWKTHVSDDGKPRKKRIKPTLPENEELLEGLIRKSLGEFLGEFGLSITFETLKYCREKNYAIISFPASFYSQFTSALLLVKTWGDMRLKITLKKAVHSLSSLSMETTID